MAADPVWYEWAFWTKDPESLRDLVLIFAAAIGAALLVWRTIAVSRGATAAHSQARTTTEAHMTERLATSFEQLSDDRLEKKLAGLYVLERLAHNSESLHWPIMKTLFAYVRENSPFIEWSAHEGEEIPDTKTLAKHWWAEPRPSREIDFVVRVVCDRNARFDPYNQRVNLWGSRLNGLNFRGGKLNRANVLLCNLRGANFSGAKLREACLVHARLEGAVLNGADLTRADLNGAHFEGVDLTRTKGLTQPQLNEAIGDENSKLPIGLTIGTEPKR